MQVLPLQCIHTCLLDIQPVHWSIQRQLALGCVHEGLILAFGWYFESRMNL